ncbi:MAG: hypothetical protein EBR82_10410 [Caulobacteraceae bacterium]|nr:hypothetical protein [Caulobacteraceae bacterium]
MADIRINSLPSTATSFNTDDYIPLDGASGGTRKMLAATLPLKDVTFGGASGPSAKSSIAARAARQGLVQDGTAANTVTVSAVGSTDFSIGGWVRQTSAAIAGLIAGNAGSVALYILANGTLRVDRLGTGSTTASTGTVTAGKDSFVMYVRSGTTGTYYIDGVAAGTTSDSFNYSTAIGFIGGDTASTNVLNGKFAPYAYNRALTAAEVVSLYESGVPAGSDYNTASNTSVVTGFTNGGVSGSNTYGTYSGASATGFTAATTGATGRSVSNTFSIVTGNRYRVSFTLTLNSGAAPAFVYLTNGTLDNPGSNTPAAAAGSNVLDFTATATTAASVLEFVSTAAGNFVISSLTLTRLGLLLAPDAGQAGGGLTWYDTSGNAANITLPATGVSWNVPSSRYLGGNWTTSGNLTVSGGTTSVLGVGSGDGKLELYPASQSTYKPYIRGGYSNYALEIGVNATPLIRSVGYDAPTSVSILTNLTVSGTGTSTFGGPLNVKAATNLNWFQTTGTAGAAVSFRALNDAQSAFVLGEIEASTLRLNSASGGDVLVGTTTNSGNGRIQLANHTTSAGGIGFGTDVSLFRSAAGTLFTTAATFTLPSTGDLRWDGGGYVTIGASSSLVFRNLSAATILTLDGSSQNATFAAAVKLAAGNALGFGSTGGANGFAQYYNSTDDKLYLYNSNGGATLVATERTTGNTKFTGTVAVQGTAAQIYSGTGSPEGVVTASPGSLYLNVSGGNNTTLYVKQSGTGNTGWNAK